MGDISIGVTRTSVRKKIYKNDFPDEGNQREGMDPLKNQTMPSLRDVAHGGVLCTFSNRSAPYRGKWCGPSGLAAWTVHHVQDYILLGHSPPASQAGRRVGPAL
jgi:hypothetical protein